MTGTIQSNSETASVHASRIAASASSMGSGTASKDETSEYGTNTTIKGYIDKEAQFASELSGDVSDFVGLVHGITGKFEATDAQIKAQLEMWRQTSKVEAATGSSRSATSVNPSLPGTETLQKAGLQSPGFSPNASLFGR